MQGSPTISLSFQKMTKNWPFDDVITNEVLQMPVGDPVLVLIWNPMRLQAAAAINPAHTKQSVVNRLLANGGSDPKNTQAIFHFPLSNDIQTAREDFLANAVWVMGTTPQMRQNLAAPAIDPVAETYMVLRITKTDLDYSDAQFFYY